MCVYVSVSVCPRPHAYTSTDPDVTWGSGRGCPLVVHYWAHLQSVHGLRCYGNTKNAWQSPAVIRQAHRMHYACRRRLPSPAIKSTHLQRDRSISSILWGVVMRMRNLSEYVLVLAVCLVSIICSYVSDVGATAVQSAEDRQ